MTHPDQLALLPGAAAAIRRLNQARLLVIVITNQRAVARGQMGEQDLRRVHRRLCQLLVEEGPAYLDAILYCPHERGICDCRKPGVGLFLRARARWPQIELSRSAMIGDSRSDVLAGRRLGMQTILIGARAPDLAAAVDQLLSPPLREGARGDPSPAHNGR